MEISQMLDLAKQTAKDLSFQIRHDLLEVQLRGVCEFGGKKWIILDVGQNSLEQLHVIGNALSLLEKLDQAEIPVVLREVWKPYVTPAD